MAAVSETARVESTCGFTHGRFPLRSDAASARSSTAAIAVSVEPTREGWRDAETTLYDLIGDIHGCAETLRALLGELGYADDGDGYRHPSRTVIFLGTSSIAGRGSARP
jgi:hypothetical protein